MEKKKLTGGRDPRSICATPGEGPRKVRMKRILQLLLLVITSIALFAQSAHPPLTNADVLKMVNSGMAEQTIVLLIQNGAAAFDTSPNTLIALKKQGLSDQLLNAMISAPAAMDAAPSRAEPKDCGKLLDAALDAVGPRSKLVAVNSSRWKGTVVTAGTTSRFEHAEVYPDKVYVLVQTASGATARMVITAEFGYQSLGPITSPIADPTVESSRRAMEFSPVVIAQHRQDYVCVTGETEQIGGVASPTLTISKAGHTVSWSIDPATKRVLRARFSLPGAGEVVTNHSDWRAVSGFMFPFKSQATRDGHTIESTISDYTVNPELDPKLFDPPSEQPSALFPLNGNWK